ncbi:MAG TPA: hypothetical protein VM427_03160 [Patescibacteria group bacterium]|nr:hypothetical protein [Patescibacteria group bacterium]
MSLVALWSVLAVALPILAGLLAGLSSVDLAYHLRAGQQFLNTGQIPTADQYTFTAAGAHWLNQQWGAQALFAAVHRLAEWAGLEILRASLLGVIYALVFEMCRHRGVDRRRAAWLTLATFAVSASALALRPQLLGMVLLAFTLFILADRGRHPKRLWILPAVVIVWANLHGSFFLGPLAIGLAWLEDLHDRVPGRVQTLVVSVAAALAAVVNPFGPTIWSYALGLSTNPIITDRITEWQPTTLRSVEGLLCFGSLALSVVFIARRGRATAWPTLAWLAVFGAIGIFAIRGVAWWPFGAAFALAGLATRGSSVAFDAAADAPAVAADRPASPSRPVLRRANALIVGALALTGVIALPIWRPLDPRIAAPSGLISDAPPGITSALRELVGPGSRILNPQPWGSWFEFAVPEARYVIDSRIEVFPAGVWRDFSDVRAGVEGWAQIIARWQVDFVVVERGDAAFVQRLIEIGWTEVFRDADGGILAPPRATP